MHLGIKLGYLPRAQTAVACPACPDIVSVLSLVPDPRPRQAAINMRVAEVATRALIGTLAALPENAVSPNEAGLLVRQTTGCGTMKIACGNGCIPSGSRCCSAA